MNFLGVKCLMNIIFLICCFLCVCGIEYLWKWFVVWVSVVDGWLYKILWFVFFVEDFNM